MRASAWLALATFASGVVAGSPASAGVHPEPGLAVSGLLGLGEFATVSNMGIGGDAALHLVRDGGGLGLRAAGGVQLLQGYQIPTGEVIFNGTGTQPGTFAAKQNFWWVAIGPAWSKPVGSGRVDFYLMFGKALANTSSSQAWVNTTGSDPLSSGVRLMLAGAMWSPREGRVELGAELFMGGSTGFWDDPPVVVDGAGNHVLKSQAAAITGIDIRIGTRFGSGYREP